jgi:hypothetical protein
LEASASLGAGVAGCLLLLLLLLGEFGSGGVAAEQKVRRETFRLDVRYEIARALLIVQCYVIIRDLLDLLSFDLH